MLVYILIIIIISFLELLGSFYSNIPHEFIDSSSAAYLFHFVTGLLGGIMFISFLPNIILIPVWLWKKKSFFSLAPLLVSILWYNIMLQVDVLQPMRSIDSFINHENEYNSILVKVRNTELYDSIKTEYSYSNAQYYILNDNMSFLSPCGIECYNDGYLTNTAFLLKRSRGVKSGYLYSETGVFINSPRFKGWYMPVENYTNWAYFRSWYSSGNTEIRIPIDGLKLQELSSDKNNNLLLEKQ